MSLPYIPYIHFVHKVLANHTTASPPKPHPCCRTDTATIALRLLLLPSLPVPLLLFQDRCKVRVPVFDRRWHFAATAWTRMLCLQGGPSNTHTHTKGSSRQFGDVGCGGRLAIIVALAYDGVTSFRLAKLQWNSFMAGRCAFCWALSLPVVVHRL